MDCVTDSSTPIPRASHKQTHTQVGQLHEVGNEAQTNKKRKLANKNTAENSENTKGTHTRPVGNNLETKHFISGQSKGKGHPITGHKGPVGADV
jgi:hypothetical protein